MCGVAHRFVCKDLVTKVIKIRHKSNYYTIYQYYEHSTVNTDIHTPTIQLTMGQEQDTIEITPSNLQNATSEQIAASKEAAIANLLEIVAANNIQINENLRRAILGEELYNDSASRRETFSKRESVLGALVRTHTEEVSTSVTETAIGQEIREKLTSVKVKDKSFELRIKNGSYTVNAPVLPSGDAPGKQHIETVVNSGGGYKCVQAMKRLFTTGKLKQLTEEKVIMDGVNLALEEGKMYLILGAPGCGKSTREYIKIL